jgi:DNA-binding response OmpR family regulator
MTEAVNQLLLSRVTLLIVEDDENTLNSLQAILKKYLKDVYIAKDGQDGLKLFKEKRPDIVLSDINMPNIRGTDMCSKIKEIEIETQVVFMTAHKESDILLDAIEAGADSVVIKPIELKKLLATLTKSAKVSAAHKYAMQTHKLVQHILDVQDNIVVLTDGVNISSANHRFLEFFGYESLKDFKLKHKCVSDFFIQEDNYIHRKVNVNWVREVYNSSYISKVKMLDKEHNRVDEYIVKVAPFSNSESNEKFVVSFTDITN